jgi:ABC-type branched-subunit amino acid transport system substrate-binding protein
VGASRKYSRNRRRALSVVAVAVTALLTVSACSSSKSGGKSSSSAGSASNAASAATGANGTIKLMVVAAVKAKLQDYPDIQAGAKAAAWEINQAGGINGKEIVIDFCNNQDDPNTAASCARTAVSDGVAAATGINDIFSTADYPIYTAAGISIIGNAGSGNPIDLNGDGVYPFFGGTAQAYTAGVLAANKLGHKKVALAVTDTASSVNTAAALSANVKLAGSTYVGTVKIPATATDYSPYAQQVKDLGADAVAVAVSPYLVSGLSKAVASLGVKTQFIGANSSLGQNEVDNIGSSFDGALLMAGYPPASAAGQFPAIAKWLADLKGSGQGTSADLTRDSGINAWLAVQAFAKLAKTMTGDITAAAFTAKVKSTGPTDLEGLVTWDPSKKGPTGSTSLASSKYYTNTVKDGKIVLESSTPIDVYQGLGLS